MKKLSVSIVMIIAITLLLGASDRGFGVKYQRVNSDEIQLDFTTDFTISVVEKNGVNYTKISGAGSVVTNEKGYAEIPKLNATLQLENENDVIVSALDGEYTEIQLDHPLLPSRGTIYRNQDPETIPYKIDPKSVVDGWYPKNLTENTEPFVFRDVRGVNIYIYPIQYNAAKKTLRVYKNLTVIVKEDLSKSTNPLIIKPNYTAPTMNGIYKSLFLNYKEPKFANQLGEFGEILVIYTSRDATVIQPYIEWKRQKGFKVSTTQVATETNVKTTIQNAYNNNTNILYVQLVGDWADIKCNTISATTSADPTDPMLGCVAGTDLYPELMIGRFSASSTSEVTVQVNKAINYEKYPDLSGTWYSTGLGIGSSEGSGIGDDGEIDYEHIDVIKENKLLSYTYDTVYEAYGSPTTTTVANYVNAGLGIINYCGHGASTYWVTSNYSNTNINSSTNGSKLPFIISVACVNGAFHESSDCFAEAWLKKSGGGAVATLMATINLPWTPPMVAQDYMNDILIGGYDYSANPGDGDNTTAADQRTTYGSIVMNGNVMMLADNYSDTNTQQTMQSWTIFGDASVQVRTDTPNLIVNSSSTLLIGNYTTTITSGGSPVEEVLVSLYKDGVTVSGLTNSSGSVSLDHSFNVADDVTLTVSGYNLETEQSVMAVTGDIGGTFAISETSLSYGNVDAGADSIKTFQITNSHSTETITGTITTISGYTVSVVSKEAVGIKEVKNSMNYAVAPSSSKIFNLAFEPTADQTYNGNVTITSSDTNHATAYIAVTGSGVVPEIDIDPASISASVSPEASIVKYFDIDNLGIGTLDYSMTINYTGGKDIKGNGGPDTFGYKWTDSDEAGGPVYNWVDITGVGTNMGFTGIDQNVQNTSLGFDFDFYGTTFNTVNVCSNGWISFTSTATTYTNVSITNSAEPNNLIAPYWDDIDMSSSPSGGIYYYRDTANSRFIVSYVNVENYSTTTANTFQIILYESGKIVYQYNTMNGSLTSCTVGIENSAGTDGSLVTYNSAYLKNNFAIQFQSTPEWLSLDGTSGSIVGVGSDTIGATCDATGLELGIYTADIYIASNDTDEATKMLPVTFTVAENTGGTFSMSETLLEYGNVTVGSSLNDTFMITNSHSSETISGSVTTISGYTVSVAAKEVVKDAKNVLPYTVGPNSTKTFNLLFEPAAEQSYNGNITITSSDTNHATEYIAVTGTGVVPEIDVNPSSISASCSPLFSVIKNFDIDNLGAGTLDYSISINYTSGKDIKGSGGPDAYGYKWTDSDEAGGPVYNWVDITGVGTAIALSDDGESGSISIGMTFNFYGVDYTSLVIGSNGAVMFNGTDLPYGNLAIPTAPPPNAIIAPFWDDLNPEAGGNTYYYNDVANNRFIVSYVGIEDYDYSDAGGANTFQAIIYTSGKIVFQYGTMNGLLNECTIGIENGDGLIGTQVVFNAAYLKSNHAIQFQATPEWLSLNSSSGSIAASTSAMIATTCDATDLDYGIYTADLTITSNDPDEPSKVVPVTLVVSDQLSSPGNTAVATATATEVNLGWDAVSGATLYRVYRSTNPYSGFVEVATPSTNSYQDTDVLSGNKYFYYITADNAKK